ncbi:hypothetical protein ES705_13330 [subsurface metagenome]
MRGGKRNGVGRPKGSLDKKTLERRRKIEEIIKLLEKGLSQF